LIDFIPHAVTLSFSHLKYFILPAHVCASLTINFHALLDNSTFLLPVYHKDLDPNKHSTFGRSLVQSQMMSLEFFIDILPIALWPWGWLSL